jgi:hypothetical protein
MSASTSSSADAWPHVPKVLGRLEVSAVSLGPDGSLYSLDRAGRRSEQRSASDDPFLARNPPLESRCARDADIERTGPGLFRMAMFNCGQICTAPKRIWFTVESTTA